MRNTYLHILCALFFTLTLVSPTVFSLLDHAPEISILIDIEEEENKGEELVKDSEFKQEVFKATLNMFNSSLDKHAFAYYTKQYTSPLQKQTLPPPEVV